jgi:hypothetical protein
MTLRLHNLSSLASLAGLARHAARDVLLGVYFESRRTVTVPSRDRPRFFRHLILETRDHVRQDAVCVLGRAPEVLRTELARVDARGAKEARPAHGQRDVGRVCVEGHEVRVEQRRGHSRLAEVQEHADGGRGNGGRGIRRLGKRRLVGHPARTHEPEAADGTLCGGDAVVTRPAAAGAAAGAALERVFARAARCLGDAVAVVRARARQTPRRADLGAARRTESECAVWLAAVHPGSTAAHEVPARGVLHAVLDHATAVAHVAARAGYALGAHPAGTVWRALRLLQLRACVAFALVDALGPARRGAVSRTKHPGLPVAETVLGTDATLGAREGVVGVRPVQARITLAVLRVVCRDAAAGAGVGNARIRLRRRPRAKEVGEAHGAVARGPKQAGHARAVAFLRAADRRRGVRRARDHRALLRTVRVLGTGHKKNLPGQQGGDLL